IQAPLKPISRRSLSPTLSLSDGLSSPTLSLSDAPSLPKLQADLSTLALSRFNALCFGSVLILFPFINIDKRTEALMVKNKIAERMLERQEASMERQEASSVENVLEILYTLPGVRE
ncbi:unnamed protein product, partial [Brassica napus]